MDSGYLSFSSDVKSAAFENGQLIICYENAIDEIFLLMDVRLKESLIENSYSRGISSIA